MRILRAKCWLLIFAVCLGTIFSSSGYAKSVVLSGNQTLKIQWSGSQFGNSASATGYLTFDLSQLPQNNATGFVALPASSVSNLTLSISGASSGNGNFTVSDFYGLSFTAPGNLNFSAQLIGQPLSGNITFGSSQTNGSAGDFNLFGQTASAPTGGANFTLITNQGAGDKMVVTSMLPVTSTASASVSVPAFPDLALWLLALVLLGISYFWQLRLAKRG